MCQVEGRGGTAGRGRSINELRKSQLGERRNHPRGRPANRGAVLREGDWFSDIFEYELSGGNFKEILLLKLKKRGKCFLRGEMFC